MGTIKSHPRVSVCVVAYNQEKYIEKCLQSIVEQEVDFEFEVIVGDDCSTDGTRAIIDRFQKDYKEKVIPVYNSVNLGPYKNLINTCQKASGHYIAHCDGDDFWLPGKLKAQVSELDKDHNLSGVFTNAFIKNDPINKIDDRVVDISRELRTVFTRSPFVRSSLVERRLDFQRISDYLAKEGKIFDFEMYWLQHANKKIMIIGHPYVFYNTDSSGISKSKNIYNEYSSAVARLWSEGLPDEVYRSMVTDLNVQKYLSMPDVFDRVGVFEYLKHCPVSKKILPRILIPAFLLKFLKSIKHGLNKNKIQCN